MAKEKKSNFLKIGCPRCNHTQVIFGKASLNVKCKKCKYQLTRTRGGKAKIRAWIKEVFQQWI